MFSTSLVAEITAQLAAAGVESPRVDAEWLVSSVLGVPRSALLLAPMTLEQADVARVLAARRERREPLQYLLGTAGFRYVEVVVGPGVFVPRPETETLVSLGLHRIEPVPGPKVVDLCAGSGAIALAVQMERPDALVWAVESSATAFAWLHRNAGEQVRVVEGDATMAATLSWLDGAVDLVISNPPYVPSATRVAPEVAHDPAEAVFGGVDGLDVIRPLIPRAAALLRPGGWLALEHDESHLDAVPELLVADGRFTEITPHRDLAERPRYTTARRAT